MNDPLLAPPVEPRTTPSNGDGAGHVTHHDAIENSLLAALPRKDYRRLLAGLQQVTLTFGEILYEPGETIRHVYFPDASLISLLTLADADVLARQWFNEVNGKPVPAYDAAIAKSLVLPKGPMPELWKQFGALNHVPVLVLRGGTSDLLSAEHVAEMGRRHPNLTAHTVPNEGHAPLLRDAATQAVIQSFLERTDRVTG